MYKDKIVEQVRKNREKLFSQFDYDISKFSAYIIEAEKISNRKIIKFEDMHGVVKN